MSTSAHEREARPVESQGKNQPFQYSLNDHDNDDQATLSTVSGKSD